MFIAQEKKKSNIAEYILYMWQIEALIRSCNLNIYLLEEAVINKYSLSPKKLEEVRQWYKNLIAMMKTEGVTKKGHISETTYIISELTMLHNMLLNLFKDEKYITLYEEAAPNITVLLEKSESKNLSDVEVCLNGLYGVMALRIMKKEISEETQNAVNSFGKMIAFLTSKYHDMKVGKFVLPNSAKN